MWFFGGTQLVGAFADDIMPLASIVVVFMIPIVAILTRHQQKMAEIYRDRTQQFPVPVRQETSNEELAAIRQLLTQQTIAMDNLATSQRELARALANQSDLANRLDVRS